MYQRNTKFISAPIYLLVQFVDRIMAQLTYDILVITLPIFLFGGPGEVFYRLSVRKRTRKREEEEANKAKAAALLDEHPKNAPAQTNKTDLHAEGSTEVVKNLYLTSETCSMSMKPCTASLVISAENLSSASTTGGTAASSRPGVPDVLLEVETDADEEVVPTLDEEDVLPADLSSRDKDPSLTRENEDHVAIAVEPPDGNMNVDTAQEHDYNAAATTAFVAASQGTKQRQEAGEVVQKSKSTAAAPQPDLKNCKNEGDLDDHLEDQLETPPLQFVAQCANGWTWTSFFLLQGFRTGVPQGCLQISTGFLWLFLYCKYYRRDLYEKELKRLLLFLILYLCFVTLVFLLTVFHDRPDVFTCLFDGGGNGEEDQGGSTTSSSSSSDSDLSGSSLSAKERNGEETVMIDEVKILFSTLGVCTFLTMMGAPVRYSYRAWQEKNPLFMGSVSQNCAGLFVCGLWFYHGIQSGPSLYVAGIVNGIASVFSLFCLGLRAWLVWSGGNAKNVGREKEDESRGASKAGHS
ncbi:unnamed protein product [Amoebophrya sp. A120]|nr:unnamed protein product [Amoebophrya sp. A120]|eukprot:GSA120T00016225001.1